MSQLTSQLIISLDNIQQLNVTTTHTVQTFVAINETVVDGTNDLQFLLAIDISALKHFTMMATKTMTIDTNSSGTPQETFSLQPNVPVTWNEGDAAIFAGDISALFATNTVDGADGTLKVIIGVDIPECKQKM